MPARRGIRVFLLVLMACGFSLQAALPRLWIWAWDRPEDLRFIPPHEAGVAFFSLGITIGPAHTQTRFRTAPLKLNRGVPRIAVVRLDMEPDGVSAARMETLVGLLKQQAQLPDIQGLQLDFDARRSQRAWYRTLLERVKSGVSVPVTITALASWCMGDPWIRGLPVDGTVAMLFQMGPDEASCRAWLERGRPLVGATQAPEWGLSTDHPLPVRPPSKGRVFVFHPSAWTPSAYEKARRMVIP